MLSEVDRSAKMYQARRERQLTAIDCADPANAAVPAQALGPHVASLGMTFYNGTMFPAEYAGSIFNAQHGSWNRDFAIGYRVMNIGVNEDGQATSYSMFANGWLNSTLAPSGSNAWGEPQS